MLALTVWSICVSKVNWVLLKCGVGTRFRQVTCSLASVTERSTIFWLRKNNSYGEKWYSLFLSIIDFLYDQLKFCFTCWSGCPRCIHCEQIRKRWVFRSFLLKSLNFTFERIVGFFLFSNLNLKNRLYGLRN